MKKIVVMSTLFITILFASSVLGSALQIRPLSLTIIDSDGYPWPWCSVGDYGEGISYYEAKGEGYYDVYVEIFYKNKKIERAKVGSYYNNTSYWNPLYISGNAPCNNPGIYTVKFIYKIKGGITKSLSTNIVIE
jgi:hypothetical protein